MPPWGDNPMRWERISFFQKNGRLFGKHLKVLYKYTTWGGLCRSAELEKRNESNNSNKKALDSPTGS